ncbi:hypothetical protein SAMN05216464_102270 [Mucilaginibacter pineti]|uniref:Uncharacterized protein n=1 Tax=Mucilaginibacter pineti TaxID=1391627 RepID=A0A1G6WR32_9SPHI|nr:hypothetical protein [Mucilaginibacter pineti]SDD68332.1 hypothetical protein SAMN05216464_102270 [Mucilaginibacter pineti]
MKHAFIFGTTIFLSEYPSLTFSDGANSNRFLRILSFNHQKRHQDDILSIDASITSVTGEAVTITGNRLDGGNGFKLDVADNRVKLYQNGHEEPVLDVYELNEYEHAGLSSHITNEIEAQQPDVVLTIKGNFKVNGAHFLIENEKMFVGDNAYANGVVNAHHGVILSAIDLPS